MGVEWRSRRTDHRACHAKYELMRPGGGKTSHLAHVTADSTVGQFVIVGTGTLERSLKPRASASVSDRGARFSRPALEEA